MGGPSHQRVAVIIPVYRAHYLAEALDSVFMQTRPADEVIVVDDGSPDRDQLQQAIAPYGSGIVVLRQANRGAGAARNRGIAAASAPLVAFLDADDRWTPHFLRHQLAALAAAPALDLSYTDGVFIGRSALAGRTFMSVCPSAGEITLEALLAQQCTVLLSSVVARRQALLAVGGFDESIRRGQDFDLWLRMAAAGARLACDRRVLTLRRMHAANLSGTGSEAIDRPIAVLEKALGAIALTPRERAAATGRLADLRAQRAREQGKELLARGDMRAARRALAEASRGLRTWKLQAAVLAMHIAPQLVRRVYLSRALTTASS